MVRLNKCLDLSIVVDGDVKSKNNQTKLRSVIVSSYHTFAKTYVHFVYVILTLLELWIRPDCIEAQTLLNLCCPYIP